MINPMPDIAMCNLENCPSKNKCFRYMAEPNPYRQTNSLFSDDEASLIENGKCEEFINIENNNLENKMSDNNLDTITRQAAEIQLLIAENKRLGKDLSDIRQAYKCYISAITCKDKIISLLEFDNNNLTKDLMLLNTKCEYINNLNKKLKRRPWFILILRKRKFKK